MPLLWVDSFGHYTSAAAKYTTGGGSSQINLPAANARTNTGVLQITGGTDGPTKVFAAHYTSMIAQVAVRADSPSTTQNPTIMQFQNASAYNIAVRLGGDGSILIYRGAGDTAEVFIASSTNRPFIWNTWNTVECLCVFDAVNGQVVVNVNGQSTILLIAAGLRTVAFAGAAYSDRMQLFGAGGVNWFMADYVVMDASSAPNNTFMEGVKVYVTTPFSNGNPVNWIPLSGSNFSEVNQIPPPGDTSYNSSGNIGDVDQYQVNASVVPGAATINGLQHCMDLKVDSGARTVASDVGGTPTLPGFALTTSYLIYAAIQDSVPPFPVSTGPKVTA